MKHWSWPKEPFRTAAVCDCGEHGFVGLTKGLVAFFSADDLAIVEPHRWHYAMSRTTSGYARTSIGDKRDVYLHRIILKTAAPIVDHKDGDGLNNRRENLRGGTQQNNMHNIKAKPSASRYKGLTQSRGGRWCAAIRLNGKSVHLGVFDTQKLAAMAYDRAAIVHFGEFAKTNESMGYFNVEEPNDVFVRKPRKKMATPVTDRVVALIDQGMSCVDISKALGIIPSSVSRSARFAGRKFQKDSRVMIVAASRGVQIPPALAVRGQP